MPVDANTTRTASHSSAARPRSSSTADQTPTILAVLADRCAAWDGLLRIRVGNDRKARAAARTALRAAAHVLAPSLKNDEAGVRAFTVRTLLARRRPAGLHPRRPWARAVLVEAITSADRKDDDRGLRAAVASLTGFSISKMPSCITRALYRNLERRHDSMRRGLDRLVAANIRLAYRAVARHLGGRDAVLGLERADLEQEATLGLLHGLRSFDPSRGFAVSTYVSSWIKHAITRAIADQAATIRAPVHLVETMSKIAAVRREHPGDDLTVEDLARLTGRPAATIRTALEQYPLTMSADAPIGESVPGGGTARAALAGEVAPTFLERLEDPTSWDLTEVIARREMAALVHDAVARLPSREAHVLRTRYLSDEAGGHPGGHEHTEVDGVPTFESVGRSLGVSRERVRQIEGVALATVRRRVGNGGRRTGEQAELFACGGGL